MSKKKQLINQLIERLINKAIYQQLIKQKTITNIGTINMNDSRLNISAKMITVNDFV